MAIGRCTSLRQWGRRTAQSARVPPGGMGQTDGCSPSMNTCHPLHLHVLGATLLCLAFSLANADATIIRSSSAKATFKREHPCPATGARSGPCGGYVIDHIVPLACGGADA